MAKDERVRGATSQIFEIFVQNAGATNGAGLTGLVFNSASLTAYYKYDVGTAAVALTLANVTTIGTWANNGFREVDSTNMPGVYEFNPPNAAFSNSTANSVTFVLKGATNMAPVVFEVALKAVNTQNATTMGLSALPNAAAEAAGGLYTRGSGAGQINQDANGRIDVNNKAWLGGTIPAVNVTGVPLVDAKYLLGTIFSTPATAGILDVNVKNMNNVAAASITTINANIGTTQPENFTGTGASALLKADMVDVAGAAVSTSSAQIGVNVVNLGGTPQTGRDVGASVLLSSGTGAGQLDFTLGVVNASLGQILKTAFTEGAGGRIAAAFKQFFNIASPAATMDHGILTDTTTTLTNAPSDSSGVTTLLARLTALRAGYLDNLSAGAAALEASVQAVKAKTDQITFTIANKVDSSIQAAGDFAQAAADKVWASAARSLTTFGTLVSDIWSAATRTLTAFGFSVTASSVTDKTGYSIGAGGITTASFDNDALSAAAWSAGASAEIVAAIKAMVIETDGSITFGQSQSVILAAVAGVTASNGTVLKSPSGGTVRITATVDASQNRTVIVLNPSA